MKSQLHTSERIFSSFRLGTKGLSPVGQPSFAEWLSCGHFIKNTEQSTQFWIGDWLLYGEQHYGRTQYQKAIEETGLDYQTLRDYKWVAHRVPQERRLASLSFHHHKEVANLSPETQVQLLHRAEVEGWPLLTLKQVKFKLHEASKQLTPAPDDPGFLLGDCRSHLASLPDESIDLLLTDPPYGIDYETTHREVNPFPKLANDRLEDLLPLLDTTLAIAARKLKPNSHLYIFTSWKTYPQMMEVIANYFVITNLLVWVKNNWTAGDLDANYGQIHEFILFAQKGQKPLSTPGEKNLLAFPRVPENGRVHPTEKPLPLLEYLIEQSSHPGALVVDPFAGVASTCLAARKKGRHYLGIELDEQWYKQGLARLHAHV